MLLINSYIIDNAQYQTSEFAYLCQIIIWSSVI